jgi:hypothetical protein
MLFSGLSRYFRPADDWHPVETDRKVPNYFVFCRLIRIFAALILIQKKKYEEDFYNPVGGTWTEYSVQPEL